MTETTLVPETGVTEPVKFEVVDPIAARIQKSRLDAFEKVFGVTYMERFTDPIHFTNGVFLNYRIHKFYENNFAFMSRNLFSEYVYLRRPKYNREILAKYHDLMARKLASLETLLKRFNDQIDVVMQTNGVTLDDIGYLRPNHELVPVIHAQSRQYLDVLKLADALFTKTAAAVLQGVISSEAKRETENKTILAMRGLGNTVRSEAITLRKEAQRVRKVMKDEGVEVDHELDTAIETQSKVIEEGDEVERANAAIDGISSTPNSTLAQYALEKHELAMSSGKAATSATPA